MGMIQSQSTSLLASPMQCFPVNQGLQVELHTLWTRKTLDFPIHFGMEHKDSEVFYRRKIFGKDLTCTMCVDMFVYLY